MRRIQNVVKHARRNPHHFGKAVEVEFSLLAKGVVHEQSQVDGAQAAAAIGGQGLFGAGVGGLDHFAVIEVVVLVFQEQT